MADTVAIDHTEAGFSTGESPCVDLARALLRCPSVTPAEGGALDLLGARLGDAGFRVERVRFSAPGTPDIDNLYARYGTAAPCLVLAGHTDVVPTGDVAAWSLPPFAGDIREGVLYGRGAVDMKGAIAALAASAIAFVCDNPDFGGSIAFLITGDEEGPAINGTVKLLQWARERGEVFDHCLLGEPTNPAALGEMMKIGRRGSLTGRLTVKGTQGHVAYPHLADNPIPLMLRLLGGLTAEALDAGTARFDASNLEVITVDVGNGATNVIPGEARAVFNIRFNDVWTPQTLRAEIERRLATAAGGAVNYEVVFDPTNAVAFVTEPGPFVTLVAEAIAAQTGRHPVLSTTGGTSDARFIKDYCPVVEFGLVGDTMHQIDERVPVADLDLLAAIYGQVLENYFSETSAPLGAAMLSAG